MTHHTFETGISGGSADEIVRIARTGLGDELRSAIYFTPSAFDVLYVRQDLYESTDEAREAKSELIDMETVGFAEVPIRNGLEAVEHANGIGEYSFTIRVHGDGFVVRKIVDDVGVVLTTDSMDVAAFRDAATAIERLLSE
ncbi:hypothetical protein SAMN05444422_10553 [Halobiforma haloterrestris]|uniref:Uncharacterized protein n=1 Tax=Natronobacterium haloterrestre TaxID=148448 RepID=A0A1I1GW95_NATHA|nr:hypothetical protein [Halobiforma haloterrestris]SFC15746.1 hypothetical protein SAMN05444422_10553 [Halobiforma haloterrestris]